MFSPLWFIPVVIIITLILFVCQNSAHDDLITQADNLLQCADDKLRRIKGV